MYKIIPERVKPELRNNTVLLFKGGQNYINIDMKVDSS